MIFRSVSSRLATWTFIGSTLVLVATGAALLVHARQQLLAQTHREAMALASGTAARIAGRVGDAIAVTRLLRGALPSRAADAEPLLRDTMRGHPDLDGIAAAFVRPEGPGDTKTAPLVVRDGAGNLRAVDLGTGPTDFRDQEWFGVGLRCENGCWRRPFLSALRQRMVLGYMEPMEAGAGVVTAEFSVAWLQSLLQSLPEPDGGYAFVMGRDGFFLAHEKPGFTGTTASEVLRGAVAGKIGGPLRMTVASGARVNEDSWVYLTPIDGTPWLFGLVIPEQRMYEGLRRAFIFDLAVGALGLLLLALSAASISRRLLKPLTLLTAQAERIAAGDILTALPLRLGEDEIGRLGRAFVHMKEELQGYIASIAANSRATARMDSQLEIALQIQRSMLPPPALDMAAFRIDARLQPAQVVGGDLYFYAVSDERIWLLLGDVSDKGIAAALFMARTVTLARSMLRDAATPSELLRSLNEALARDNEACMFTTLACIRIERKNGLMQAASAGHDAPLLWRGGTVQRLGVESGPALGLDAHASYDMMVTRLLRGDALLLYSDGITEAEGDARKPFGDAQLATCWRGEQGVHASPDDLLAAVAAHAGPRAQSDDIALLCIDWHHTEASPPFRRRLAANHESVFAVLDQLERHLQERGASDELCGDVRLAAEELMVNIVEHGGSMQAGMIDMDLDTHNEAIVLTLCDDGPAFDLLGHHRADEPTESSIGGLGIHLALHVAQSVTYRREDNCNIVTLRFSNHVHTNPESL